MLIHTTELDRKRTLFFQEVITVKLDFMKMKITPGAQLNANKSFSTQYLET